MGIIINHEIRIPSLNNHYVLESKAGLLSGPKCHPEFRLVIGDDSFSPWKPNKYCISIPLVMSFPHRIGAVVFFFQSETSSSSWFFLFEKLEYVSYRGQYLKKNCQKIEIESLVVI